MANVVAFNYGSIESFEVLERVRGHTAAIHTLVTRTTKNLIEIGQRLMECRTLLGRGYFPMWIRAEFSLSETQAYAMCKVAQRFQSIEAAGNIKPSALLFLARSTVPDEAVKEIVEKAATGKTVGYAEAKTISKKHGYKPLHNPKAAQSLTPAPKPATMPAGGPLIQELQNRVLELANVVGPAFMSQLLRKLADQLDGSGADNSAAIAELPGDTIDAECISKSELVTAGV